MDARKYRIPTELIERLEKFAEDEGSDPGAIIAGVVAGYLDRIEHHRRTLKLKASPRHISN